MVLNTALVFLKPNVALKQEIRDFVRKTLEDNHINILEESFVSTDAIRDRGLVDQHYAAIAKRGAIEDPNTSVVSIQAREAFKTHFGLEWEEADKVNAIQFQELTHCTASELQEKFQGPQKRMGPGFYVAPIQWEGHKLYYVVNGFYPRMREKFLRPDEGIYYWLIQFDPEVVSWNHFRINIIGVTNPTDCLPESMRAHLFANFERYAIEPKPNIADNCIHASAGPLEGARERMIWTGKSLESDLFLQELHSRGASEEEIQWLLSNPIIALEGQGKKSVFDYTEDCDSPEAITRLLSVLPQRTAN